MAPRRSQLPEGYEALISGAKAFDIVIKSKVKKDIGKKANRNQQAELEDLLRRYAKDGPSSLPSSKWNGNEGWFPSSKSEGKVRLEAVKPWQLRAYGFACEFNGRPTFFVTGFDPSKKQDGANQDILRASGREAFDVSRFLKS